MWQIGLLSIFIAATNAGYASSGAGSYAGSTGGPGLYTSNYVSDDTYGPKYPYLGGFTYVGGGGLIPPIVPPFVGFGFNNDLQNFIHSQYNQLQSQFNSIASQYYDQFAKQQEFFNHLQQTSNIQPGETVIYTNVPADKTKVVYTNYAPTYSGAAASGSIGPGGVYQSVSTYPGGTLSNRFGGTGGTTYTSHSGGPGFSGISTFSSSDSSGNRQAVTSVNDNGKVTTYHTRN